MVTIETHKSKITQAREESLHELVARLDIPVSDISIIDCAFTHTSYANEHKSKHIHHNQRLEFLGDAVLDLIIGEYLFKTYPDMAEGDLTKIKAATVCEDSLASVSRSLQLGQYHRCHLYFYRLSNGYGLCFKAFNYLYHASLRR